LAEEKDLNKCEDFVQEISLGACNLSQSRIEPTNMT